jgi:hypothetical protein
MNEMGNKIFLRGSRSRNQNITAGSLANVTCIVSFTSVPLAQCPELLGQKNAYKRWYV